MTEHSHNTKDLLEIKKLVQFGSRKPEDYQVLFYKEVYGKKGIKVRIRGLSNYEYDEISYDMYKDVKDNATINYIFNPSNETKTKQIVNKEKDDKEEKIEDEVEKSFIDEDIPEDVNVVEMTKAFTLRNVLITYRAMKDYYNDLTVEDVKRMEGISEIADRVNEKSGRTPEIMDKIEFFRAKRRKSKSEVSTE